MQHRPAQIGRNFRIFEASAPAVLEHPAIGTQGRRLVKVHRHTQPSPNLFAGTPRNGHAILKRQAFQRNKWHHIGRTHPGMYARVFAKIDALHRNRDPAQSALRYRVRRARKRDYRAVMIRVPLRAQHQNSGRRRDRIFNGTHGARVAPLGKIGDTLN